MTTTPSKRHPTSSAKRSGTECYNIQLHTVHATFPVVKHSSKNSFNESKSSEQLSNVNGLFLQRDLVLEETQC